MTPKAKIILSGLAIALVALGTLYQQQLRGILPALLPARSPSPTATPEAPQTVLPVTPTNETGIPLSIPNGTRLETFARNLPNARVIVFDSMGNMWVSQPSQGTVSFVEIESGKAMRQNVVFRDLHNPHGLAFDPDQPTMLYIAEEHRISRVPVYSDASLEKIADLPSGGGHFTRTIAFGPDKKLYVAMGSSCNVCHESDNRRAKIFSMNKDGGDFQEYARGLRNSVFFTWHPVTGKMWATDNGRDNLGDDLPPDEVNIIEKGKNYGWPICYGNNIHDTSFDKNVYIRNPCQEPTEIPAHIAIQAHSAALGLAFVPTSGWPQEWENDLLVAYHGSWNRSVPTGYKIVRFDLDRTGGRMSGVSDFISGWKGPSATQVYGRPVGIVVGPDKAFYVSDDKAGLIYRLSYLGN